jgi:hypothetical protein
MTSQINPLNIDGNYPVAGVPNNTQGFRDNFTNTQTNFEYAADEITELQSKAVLKSALTGGVLDNNMNDSLLYAVQLSDVSYKQVQQTATSGAITLDYSAANFQAIPSATGSIVLGFSNFPAAGTVGVLNLSITVTNTAYTLTLPIAVSVGLPNIDGLSPATPGISNTITFAAAGTYVYQFETADAGTTISVENTIRPSATLTNTVTVGGTAGIRSIGTGTIGYGVGAGGTVSQGTNKSGNVVLNEPSGQITMQNTSLSAATTVDFFLSNSTITATDLLLINQTSTANAGGYTFNAICNAGNAQIFVRNVMASSASDAVVLRYAVVKGSIT